jgi:uncharacterized repeat protein (TIGR03803 family)
MNGSSRWLRHHSALALILGCAAISALSQVQTFTKLSDFNPNAWIPMHSLVQGTDGSLYGVTNRDSDTVAGGAVYRLTTSGGLAVLHQFYGMWPSGALTQASNRRYYGATNDVFSIDSTGKVTTLYTSQASDGGPSSNLVLARDGNLYGTTYTGGIYGGGTLYQVSLNGAKKTIYNFCLNCVSGTAPFGPLIQATDGNFYGTTVWGGCCNNGTVFRITPAGKLTTLHSFCQLPSCADGSHSESGVIQGTDGNFYGTTNGGGAWGKGTIFQINPSGFTTWHNFGDEPSEGTNPFGSLIQATDGRFYGTTWWGGTHNVGTVFRISSTTGFQTLHSFDTTDGSVPYGALLQATDGMFYGTAASGGGTTCAGHGCGTAFRISVGLAPFVRALQPFGRVGSSVLILGTNLTGTTSVVFKGIPAQFIVLTAGVLKATVPAGATSGKITVVTPRGTLVSDVRFQILPAL